MITILFGLIMIAAHYLDEYVKASKKYHSKLISLSAGISVTYIFIDLFPNFSSSAQSISRFMFLFVLLGFVILHVVEKYLYQHVARNKLRRDLAIEHATTSFLYHFIIGLLLVYISSTQGLVAVTLFFIPAMLFTIFSTLPLHLSKHPGIRFMVATGTLIGVVVARVLGSTITPVISVGLLGFVIGVITYSIIRHSIPFGKKGEPLYFILGSVIYAGVIIASWMV